MCWSFGHSGIIPFLGGNIREVKGDSAGIIIMTSGEKMVRQELGMSKMY